jgi:hypothetical protein
MSAPELISMEFWGVTRVIDRRGAWPSLALLPLDATFARNPGEGLDF